MMKSNEWADTQVQPRGGRGGRSRGNADPLPATASRHGPDSRPFVHRAAAKREPLRDALTAAFRFRWRILLAFLLPLAATLILAGRPLPTYTSKASLLVMQARAPAARDAGDAMRAEIELLASRDVRQAALERVGITAAYAHLASVADAGHQRDEALTAMNRDLDIDANDTAGVIALEYSNADAAMSARLLNAVIEAYLNRRRAIFEPAASSATASTQPNAGLIRTRLAVANHKDKAEAAGKARPISTEQAAIPAAVAIMQPAREPREPSDSRGLVIAAGLLVSLLLAWSVAVASARWRKTYTSPRDVEQRLGLPILAAVPQGGLT